MTIVSDPRRNGVDRAQRLKYPGHQLFIKAADSRA